MAVRVTQIEIARRLGVHVTTVSKALKGNSTISKSTQNLVRKTAQEMGYAPDPLLGALAAYRSSKRPPAFQAVLGWICNYPEGTSMRQFAGFDHYFQGAHARALELGYRLDVFHAGKDRGALSRLSRILHARNIAGLVISPQIKQGVKLEFDWERYAAVTIGFTLVEPRLHVVTNDHFRTILTLIEVLRGRGYERIGCYLRGCDNERIEGRFGSALGAILASHRNRLLVYEQANAREFLKWRQRADLDAVVTGDRKVLAWLRESGIDVPEAVGVAHYALDSSEKELSGMDHNNLAIGAAAVDGLTGLILRGEKGPPTHPTRLMVESTWIEGKSLRTPLSSVT